MISAADALLGSSATKYSALDCQRPELLNKRKVQGKILLCGYSFNYISGTASIKKVSQTAKSLGAAGFIVAVENSYPGTKFDPVPVSIPGILITDVSKTTVLYFCLSSYRALLHMNAAKKCDSASMEHICKYTLKNTEFGLENMIRRRYSF